VKGGQRAVATNRRARHDYDIEESFEVGLVLTGAEVKSLRSGRASLADAFGRVRGGEVWVEGMHIPPYGHAADPSYEPKRPRKLLLRREQIERLIGKTQERGLTLIPLRLYFTRGLAKIELGLGRGRRKYEKRQVKLEQIHKREAERELARRNRGR
jgi:SsrA-binding protein